MKRSIFTVGAAIALTLFVTGCGPSSSHFKDVKSAVFDGNVKLNTSVELSLGIVPIWLASKVAGFVDEPEAREASEYLDHISRVDVGIYELQDSMKGQFREISKRVTSAMLENGFEPVVLVRERNECVGVYAPLDQQELAREVFVVVLEKKEVVLVRTRGNFEKIVTAAMRYHGHELPNFQKVLKEEMVL